MIKPFDLAMGDGHAAAKAGRAKAFAFDKAVDHLTCGQTIFTLRGLPQMLEQGL
jgi:hypothetical protein